MSSGFINISFPITIAYGSEGGPRYNTAVITTKSGKEKRNINWEIPRIEYNAATGIREMEELQELITFFHVVQGMAYTFRFKDYQDFKSCRIEHDPSFDDQKIGEGDGYTTEFQLLKTYLYEGELGNARAITKPVEGTVLIGVGGIETDDWSIDYNTGVIKLGNAPSVDTSVTAGYEFDIEARFDTDKLPTNLEDYRVGVVEVPIIEVVNKQGSPQEGMPMLTCWQYW